MNMLGGNKRTSTHPIRNNIEFHVLESSTGNVCCPKSQQFNAQYIQVPEEDVQFQAAPPAKSSVVATHSAIRNAINYHPQRHPQRHSERAAPC